MPSAMMRPIVSVDPPAASGTRIVIGRDGKDLRVRAADRAARGQRNGDHRLYHLFPPWRCVHSSTSTSPGPRRSAPSPGACTSNPPGTGLTTHDVNSRPDATQRHRRALDRDAHLLGRRQRFADPARPVVRRAVDHRGRIEGDRLRHRRRAAGAVARGVAGLVRRRRRRAADGPARQQLRHPLDRHHRRGDDRHRPVHFVAAARRGSSMSATACSWACSATPD